MSIFKTADILLPKDTDMTKWSVVACDQYSSEPEYWQSVAEYVGDAPSTLKVIFPEAYLNDGESYKRIKMINAEMRRYLKSGLFREYKDSLIYVERTQRDGRVRHGLIGAIDLEDYEYFKGSQSLIRATEGTIIERIPPRKRIRQGAALELPHIIMLIDDRHRRVVESVTARKKELEQIYDFDLMQNGGHVEGRLLDEKAKEKVFEGLKALTNAAELREKYGSAKAEPLIYAVGDGNHSLATAKACWVDIKKSLTLEEQETHPARFALVELMNLHDEALEFEPIYRVAFGVDTDDVVSALFEYYPQASVIPDDEGQKIIIVRNGEETPVYIKDAPSYLAVGTLQAFLDDYIEKHGGEIDYIHGADVVRNLSKKENSIGFIYDGLKKNDLFQTVIKDGALPRKTFSMGEAHDKRYYLEAKRI